MSLKRSRVHLSGISNIDFRTKGEIEEIKKYQPYHESKNFGMLGLGNYKLPYSIHKELFKLTITDLRLIEKITISIRQVLMKENTLKIMFRIQKFMKALYFIKKII